MMNKEEGGDYLAVAKMDATANDVPPMFGQIKGYPSVFFVPAANKEAVVAYEGQLDYKGLKVLMPYYYPIISLGLLAFHSNRLC